jgi:hypothetical protein
MARPELEPGTPRFSVTRSRPRSRNVRLQISGFRLSDPATIRGDMGGCNGIRDARRRKKLHDEGLRRVVALRFS